MLLVPALRPSSAPRLARGRIRPLIVQLHLWLGIGAGLYVIVVSLTGAALLFRIDMQKMAFPHLLQPPALAPPADIVRAMEALRAAFPGHRLSGVDAPTTARPTFLAYAERDRQFSAVLLDPVSGRVLGELPQHPAIRALQQLHFDLFGGRTGRLLNGAGAICLLVMSLTGVIIWWPGVQRWKQALRFDPASGWTRLTRDLHGAAGIWTALFLVMWSVTGLYFTFPSGFRALVSRVSPLTTATTPSPNPAAQRTADPPTWQQLVDTARQARPGEHVARVVIPATGKDAFQVLFYASAPTPLVADLTPVYLDQFTGRILDAPPQPPRSAGDTIMAWVIPLHVGNFGGSAIKLAWLILGLAPSVLAVTGTMMWWRRTKRRRPSLSPMSGVSSADRAGVRAAQ